MNLEILELAENDLIEGFHFYENQGAGLGDYFLDHLYSDIDLLKAFGGIHRKAHKNFYRALSKRFPFAIYYSLQLDTVIVRSVVDCRRSTAWIRTHLKNA
jgi:plasmid stabilization system protein ParE